MSLKWSSVTDQLYAVSNSSPSLDLDFAANKTLDDNISGNNLVTFSRASSGTYVGSDGLIKTSAVNLLKYSEDFSPSWFAGTATVSAAPSVLSPTGTANTKELSVGTRYASLSDVTAGNQYTFSIYVRSAGLSTQFTLTSQGGFGGSTGDRSTIFNIIDGTLVSSGAGVDNYSITSSPNGWYRVSQTDTATTSGSTTWQVESVNSSAYIWGAQLEENPTATTYIPTTTTIGGAPRFDHDPVTGESLGLLIEEARTNSILWSEDFNNAAWAKVSGGTGTSPTVTSNYTTGPDGVSGSASRIQASITGSSSGDISLVQQINTSTSNVYGSIWVKSNTGSNQTVYFRCIGDDQTNTETVTTEWTRLGQQSSAAVSPYITVGVRGSATGPASIDVSVFGGQIEAGLFPTSYIPTTSSTVPREADVATIEGTNFSSWYNDSASTLYIESPDFPNYGNRSNSAFVYISDATVFNIGTGDGIKFGTGSPNTHNRVFVTEGGAGQADGLTTQGSKFAIAVSENDFNYTVDGTNVGTDNTVVMPTGMDRLAMTGYGPGLAHLSRLTYYPYRLSDTILQEITS
jgi:hypothetical protein